MKIASKILCLCSVLFLTSCKDYIFPSTWNYRITVEIETPEGIKTGSAVRQVRAWENITQFVNPDVGAVKFKLYGEAVAIDLGQGKYAFALIEQSSYSDLMRALPSKVKGAKERMHYYASLKSGTKGSLDKDNWPRMVTFQDMKDPKSVIVLSGKKNNLKLSEEYHIRNIVLEITEEPIKWEIKKILPSYDGAEFQHWYNKLPYGDVRKVHGYHFIKRKEK